MSLKEILGDDYREDMTDDEISAAMEKRFLASGKYESKEKVNAERKKALNEKKDLEAKIKAKMSEDELGAKELEDLTAENTILEERIVSLTTEKEELENRISTLEENIASLAAQITTLTLEKEELEVLCNYLLRFKDIQKKVGGRRELFYMLIGWVVQLDGVNKERLFVSLNQNNDLLTPMAKVEVNLKEISKAYNKNYRKGNRRLFEYEWELEKQNAKRQLKEVSNANHD